MKLKIDDDTLYLKENLIIRAESIDIYELEFEFSQEWNELDKKVVFVNSNLIYEQAIFDNKIKIPPLPNGKYSIGIVGFIVENDIVIKQKSTNMIHNAIVTISAAEFEKTQEQQAHDATVYEKYLTDMKNNAIEIKKDFDNYAKEKILEIKKATDVYTKDEIDNKLKNYLEFEVVEEM